MQPKPHLLLRILGVLIGGALLLLAFAFSLVILAVLSVLASAALGYFWWKTRALRRAHSERTMPAAEDEEAPQDATERPAIEGESKRVDERES